MKFSARSNVSRLVHITADSMQASLPAMVQSGREDLGLNSIWGAKKTCGAFALVDFLVASVTQICRQTVECDKNWALVLFLHISRAIWDGVDILKMLALICIAIGGWSYPWP